MGTTASVQCVAIKSTGLAKASILAAPGPPPFWCHPVSVIHWQHWHPYVHSCWHGTRDSHTEGVVFVCCSAFGERTACSSGTHANVWRGVASAKQSSWIVSIHMRSKWLPKEVGASATGSSKGVTHHKNNVRIVLSWWSPVPATLRAKMLRCSCPQGSQILSYESLLTWSRADSRYYCSWSEPKNGHHMWQQPPGGRHLHLCADRQAHKLQGQGEHALGRLPHQHPAHPNVLPSPAPRSKGLRRCVHSWQVGRKCTLLESSSTRTAPTSEQTKGGGTASTRCHTTPAATLLSSSCTAAVSLWSSVPSMPCRLGGPVSNMGRVYRNTASAIQKRRPASNLSLGRNAATYSLESDIPPETILSSYWAPLRAQGPQACLCVPAPARALTRRQFEGTAQ